MGDDGDMRPTFAKGNRTIISRLLELRREALKDKEPRLVLRIQGILMSLEGHTTGEISHQLRVHRSTVPLWIDHWNRYGQKGLWEGHRSVRQLGYSVQRPTTRLVQADIKQQRKWVRYTYPQSKKTLRQKVRLHTQACDSQPILRATSRPL
jgi:hypothetical protein